MVPVQGRENLESSKKKVTHPILEINSCRKNGDGEHSFSIIP